ncbi:MAG TPA: sulfotransferase [Solirubrobacteraceae bacterium]|nr:sulfotransferase [Solirubrobacteraceae bacterium]
MRVIGAGFGRTGTMSLKAALEELGVGPCYHMIEALWGDTTRIPIWEAAADGEQVDWRALLAGFESTVDWPGCTFYKQLMEVFPDAKVLLTVRDPDKWYESVESSIWAAGVAGRKGELQGGSETPPSLDAFRMIGKLIWEGTFDGRFEDRAYAIDVFNRHIEEVKRTVPAERLVVHEVKDGWKPLAQMLGVPEPQTPFPRLNDKAAFREMVGLPALAG